MRDIPPDLAAYSSDKPQQDLHLLFLHHSCGGHLLADMGALREKYPGSCIYSTHPNAGGLRSALRRNNYLVHEASYGSFLGRDTDVCSWNRKFRDHLDRILSCSEQDRAFRDGTRNRVVVFKSCYTNSWIDSEGSAPGDPDSPGKTTANYKAAFLALREQFRKRPETLFVAFTSPPMTRPSPGLKDMAFSSMRMLLGKESHLDLVGKRVRTFNNWLKDMDNGWLKGYGPMNVVVFDYYHILTGHGASDWSVYPARDGVDSHPNSEGNTRAAQAFIPFLNKAVRRAGLMTKPR